jgi:hypothetical protein
MTSPLHKFATLNEVTHVYRNRFLGDEKDFWVVVEFWLGSKHDKCHPRRHSSLYLFTGKWR